MKVNHQTDDKLQGYFNYKVSLFFYTKFIKKGENAMKNTAISATKKNTHNITFPKNKNGRA